MTVQSELMQISKQSDLEINLLNGALALAKWSELDLNIEPYQRHGTALVRDLKAYVGADHQTIEVILDGVRQILAKRYGYALSNDSAELEEPSNLAHTIERRRGCPLTLCILYAHVLDQMSTRVDIIDFPARPLVRVLGEKQHIIIDPVSQGKQIKAAHIRDLFNDHQNEHDAPTINPFAVPVLSRRQALLKIQDDLKLHMLRQNAPEAAIAAIEASLLIAPNEPRLWREIGILHARLDHISQSIAALKRFLSFPSNDQQRYSASQLLQRLQKNKDS